MRLQTERHATKDCFALIVGSLVGLCLSCAGASELRAAVFESGHVRPVALTPDGRRLLVVNTPDGRLEVLSVTDAGLEKETSIRVGLEPVAVAVRDDSEAWVVNHLSDSVSIVDLRGATPVLKRTLLVGDEPQDIVFASGRAFITTARRGQNSPSDASLTTGGVGRADLWVFDPDALGDSMGGDPVAVLSLFGDSPRALAVSPDGERVYAAVFKSGNQTTIVSAFAVCPGGSGAPPCIVEGRELPGGLPPPTENFQGIPQPQVGLIVRRDSESGAWSDELGRDWSNAVEITLPDYDVFVIDATTDVPEPIAAYSGVGTVLYNMATHPISGKVFVSNTEAHNEVRFEPVVRGRQHLSRVSILGGDAVVARHLNKHIDYTRVPSPPETAERSLALPLGLAFEPDGTILYVAAFGSDRVGVFDVDRLEDGTFEPGDPAAIIVSGGGPSGLVRDDRRPRLYVATRFDNGVSVIDVDRRVEIQHLALHSGEPAPVIRGRRWLYDARATSSNGEAACATCHVFGDTDDLAWDLGDPDGVVLINPNPVHDLVLQTGELGEFWYDFHPMKGPLTTQTLRGTASHGAMHWRGDRSGAFVSGSSAGDAAAAFRQFNASFVSLLGAAQPLPSDALDDLAEFVLSLVPGPNPHRPLDNSLTAAQQRGRMQFFGPDDEEMRPLNMCDTCHAIDRDARHFGTNTHMSSNFESAQLMKIPSLRSVYRKVGMFGLFPRLFRGAHGETGPQVRGFGFIHDGSLGIFVGTAMDFVMAIETDLFPVVGQQLTLRHEVSPDAMSRLQLLLSRRAAGDCDLMAAATLDGFERAWLIVDYGVESDRRTESLADIEELLSLTAFHNAPITFSALPPGTGVRRALDRDGDGERDGDERAAGTDPEDPRDFQIRCVGDCNRDGVVTVDEIIFAVQMALHGHGVDGCLPIDSNRDGLVTVDEILQGVQSALTGCPL